MVLNDGRLAKQFYESNVAHYADGVLTRNTRTNSADGTHGIDSSTDYSIKCHRSPARVADSDTFRNADIVLMVLAHNLAVEVLAEDTIVFDGSTYYIVDVRKDPAGIGYRAAGTRTA